MKRAIGQMLLTLATSGLISGASELLDKYRKGKIGFKELKTKVQHMIAKLQTKDRALYNRLSSQYTALFGITGSDAVKKAVRNARKRTSEELAKVETEMTKNNVLSSVLETDLANLSVNPTEDNAEHLRKTLASVERTMK